MNAYGSSYYRDDNFQERRRKADWITKMATILSLLSWVVAIAVWAVLESASPEREMTFITSFLRETMGAETRIRDYWDATLLPVAFWLLVLALAICVTAFVFNALRMRRKTDKYRKSIIIIGAITLIGIVLFLVRFGGGFLWGVGNAAQAVLTL